MQVSVRVSGQSAVIAGLTAKVKALQAKAASDIQTAGLLCEALAKANCPVDTGLLRSSINYQKTGEYSCSVGTPVKYAPYVELGHHTHSGSFVPAHPFLFPAFQETVRRLEEQLKQL